MLSPRSSTRLRAILSNSHEAIAGDDYPRFSGPCAGPSFCHVGIDFFLLDLFAAISQAVASITSVGQPPLRPTYYTSGSNKGHYDGASDIPNADFGSGTRVSQDVQVMTR